jgi:diguanylate cyclase (GGDEF)-like protein/PAS domain S-box-containing protein
VSSTGHPEIEAPGETAENLGARLSRVLSAADDATLGPAAQTCLEQLCRYAGVDRGSVAMFDENERVTQQWGWDELGRPFDPLQESFMNTLGSVASFMRIGKTLAVGDYKALELVLGPDENRLIAEHGGAPAAGMMLPVLVGPDLVGMVSLISTVKTKEWAPQFIAEMEGFAELMVRMLGRTQHRQALAEANVRARRIADHLPDGLLMLTPLGVITWVSPSFSTMSGTGPGALERRFFPDLISAQDRGALTDQLSVLTPGTDAKVSVRMADPNGHWRWSDLSLRLASEPELGVPDEIVVTVRDAHDRHRREMKLVRASDRDALTGLANRGAFDRFIDELSSSDALVLVAFCDVDDFKAFNDELGHDTGDEVLRRVAKAIERSVRSRDLVARIGGDEFALVVVDAANEVSVLGDRLLKAVRSSGLANGPPLTMSIGVCGPAPAADARAMLTRADEAMYSAKRAGKDRWVRADPVPGPA